MHKVSGWSIYVLVNTVFSTIYIIVGRCLLRFIKLVIPVGCTILLFVDEYIGYKLYFHNFYQLTFQFMNPS